jgi:hypothetical protein
MHANTGAALLYCMRTCCESCHWHRCTADELRQIPRLRLPESESVQQAAEPRMVP